MLLTYKRNGYKIIVNVGRVEGVLPKPDKTELDFALSFDRLRIRLDPTYENGGLFLTLELSTVEATEKKHLSWLVGYRKNHSTQLTTFHTTT
jgi:hypothetical protein